MEKINTLVIGANGLVGRRVCALLSQKDISWKGTYSSRKEDSLVRLDITNKNEVNDLLNSYAPKAVILCANLAGGVDFCEKNPMIAEGFHLSATQTIGSHCRDLNATFVYISSDYVFDGTAGPYREEDSPNPLNLYGMLKLQAEQWIMQNLKKYLILRTTNVFGWDPKTATPNYIMGLYRAINGGKLFNAPSFLWGNPTYVGDLAEAILELYTKKATGIFHVVGSSFINRYEWALTACNKLNLDSHLLKEVTEPPATMIRRPFKSWLNTDRFVHAYKTVLHDVSRGLELMNDEMPR